MTTENKLVLNEHLQGAYERAAENGDAFTIISFIDEKGLLNYMMVTFERVDHRSGTWRKDPNDDGYS